MLLPEEFTLPFTLDLEKCDNSKYRKKKFSVIYMITAPDGKIYIGQGYDAESRICVAYRHEHCKKQKRLYESFQIHGSKNHKYEIIHVISDDERNNLTKKEVISKLNTLEIDYIKSYKCYYFENKEIGLNLTKGGDNKEHHPDTIKKISESQKGKIIAPSTREKIRKARTGKKASPEAIKSSSECRIGEKNHFWNKHHTEETKQIISEKLKIAYSNPENHPMWDKHHSEETKQKMSTSKIGKDYMTDEDKKRRSEEWSGEGNPFYGSSRTDEQNPMWGKIQSDETRQKISESNSIGVSQYTLNGEFIKEWKNAGEAGIELNIHPSSITKACKCKFKTADGNISKGFIWKYTEK